jgi:hypothetical protein
MLRAPPHRIHDDRAAPLTWAERRGCRGALKSEALAGMVAATPYQLTAYKVDDREVHVRAITDEVAVVAYKVHEDMLVDGKPTTLDAFEFERVDSSKRAVDVRPTPKRSRVRTPAACLRAARGR